MNKSAISISLSTVLILSFSGCGGQGSLSVPSFINKETLTAVGAIAGGIIGKKQGGNAGAFLGALVGGGLGYLIGDEIDKRRERIKEIARLRNIEIAFNDIKSSDGEKVGQSYSIFSKGTQFDSGKYVLNSGSRQMFIDIAKEYSKSGMKVMVIGHTDSDGSDEYNQALSEKRAKHIAKLLNKYGVPLDNIYYKGSGETDPIATNKNLDGKNTNRRVEIVEAQSEGEITKYAYSKPKNTGLYEKDKKKALSNKKANDNIASGSGKNNEKRAKHIAKNSKNSASATKPLGKRGSPSTAGDNKNKKFNDIDKDGVPSKTGVSGDYYVINKNNTEKLGGCNNKYFYTKKRDVELDGVQNSGNENTLLAVTGPYNNLDNSFSILPVAHANVDSSSYYGSCMTDSIKKDGDVKKLSTGEAILVKENYNMAPLLNGVTWGTQLNNEFIMINPVGVLRSNMQSVSCPELNIIKKGSNQPWYGTTTNIITYNGEKGLLYRIYPYDKSKFECIDIAFPHGNPQNAKGIVYYKGSTGAIMSKETKFFTLEKSAGNY